MELCARTCSSTKACLLFNQHKKFLRCDLDSRLLSATETEPVVSATSRVLKLKPHISVSAEVRAGKKEFKDRRAAVLASEKASAWELLPVLDATHVLPDFILHSI